MLALPLLECLLKPPVSGATYFMKQRNEDKDSGRQVGDGLPQKPWARGVEDVLDRLDSSPEGLTRREAEARLERYGPNALEEHERRGVLEILWEQVASLIMALLVVAMVVSFLTGQIVEGFAIIAVIVLNTVIGFVTEWRAVRSMEALQELAKAEARVLRDGGEVEISAEQLVPGDVVVLRSGDVVPADCRIVGVSELEIDESALTGESMPVDKEPESLDEDTELADRRSMAYRGTVVTRGRGKAVVVATGMTTELGAISELVAEAEAGGTPLEKKLDGLGQRLVWLTLGVAAVVAVAGILAGRELSLMVETSIALAVAAIPEGLPIVATVALASGMWRMLKRNALIRRLSSVETLGATTVIFTDKTGTLTENQMRVREIEIPEGRVQVEHGEEGVSYALDGEAIDASESEGVRAAMEVAALCNDAGVEGGADEPMEAALLQWAEQAGVADQTRSRFPRIRTEPFNRETKMMATFHRDEQDGDLLVAVKGAPEAVLRVCTRIRGGDGVQELGDERREHLQGLDDELAERGLRVLALARKNVYDEDADPYEGLTFVGYVGFLDPPRRDVEEVIAQCHKAGIRVIMVTGDHPATALEIARSLGIGGEDPTAVRGADLPDIASSSAEDRRMLLDAAVFARVTPEQKLALIDLQQEAGEIVAMTGDGVNDAPALRSADIGVAMGDRGTQVAREAADMVLQDDAFKSIVAAVEQGRVIFENIRRFVIYLLSGNVGEILAVAAAVTVGAPLPLLPLQILYLNMINDVFPALALGVGRGASGTMDRPPRDPQEPVLTRRGWGAIGGYGLLIAGVVLGTFFVALGPLGLSETQAVTVSFLTLSLSRLVHVFNMRAPRSGLVRNEISENRWVWGAFAVSIVLLLVAVYVPPVAQVLGVTAPNGAMWLLIASGTVVTLAVGQAALAAAGTGSGGGGRRGARARAT